MARRHRLNSYQLFMASFLRARERPGMSRADRQELMKEGARAWQRARRGHNPFPDFGPFEREVERLEGEIVHNPCPHCGELLEIPAAAHGKRGRCGVCGGEFEIEAA